MMVRPIGPLVVFPTETGIAWMLDPQINLSRDGNPEPIDFEETDTNFAMDWKGNCRIQSRAFVYVNRKSGPRQRDPWLSHFQNRAIRLSIKFQIYLARFICT
jgi:hypothetical protein